MFVKMSELARPSFKANPYPFYARLRDEAPICATELVGHPGWLVTRYSDVVAVLKDERLVKDWRPATRFLCLLAPAYLLSALYKKSSTNKAVQPLSVR